ncbi:MAG: DUF72 domain-containing protein [Acidobacteriota bacterium]
MNERGPSSGQIPLFPAATAAVAPSPAEQRLGRERDAALVLKERLPRNVRFGTSSWSFPGWEGIVYPRRATASRLAREGLIEYARHPLLTTVGIDRSFYAPIPREDLRAYGSQLPEGFLCCAKAPAAVTGAALLGTRAANPDFLNPGRFEEEMLAPFREEFADHTGPFLLQFPPAPRECRLTPGAFASALDEFLEALPRDLLYAVELRDARLLTPEYRRVLVRHRAAHVYNAATGMPMPGEQAREVPVEAPFVVVRLLLRPGTGYDERRKEFVPFDRVVDANPEMRRDTIDLIRAAEGRPVYVLVNNKAEGCAPATIRALAEELAAITTS